jgi:cysteine synthase
MDKLDAIFVPVGGGGLVAGIAAYVKALKPSIKIIGVEPSGALEAGRKPGGGSRLEAGWSAAVVTCRAACRAAPPVRAAMLRVLGGVLTRLALPLTPSHAH